MSTKNDLLAVWVRLTGDPLPEARHRVRVLSERGLLPDRAEPLTDIHFARWLLAVTGAEMHKDAPNRVMALSNFMCSGMTGDGDLSLGDLPLLQAIVAAMKDGRQIASLEVSGPSLLAVLTVHTNHLQAPDHDPSAPWTYDEYTFIDPFSKPSDFYPVRVSRSVHMVLIYRLLSELQLQEANQPFAEDAETPGRVPAP